ncbi:(3R)-3-hydroxyacyl-CoA dehydrogenase [Ixodes scapularis]|uniref:(3R)-3-hydroxyacyl-CoA dehydrogenase n=1 Tax=Ixodes scapularis TaxID=6945 RepID=UPI001A9EDF64|nr:(3R)-3-hydroxyacyl-CoA dehydrogenase [Ixodes scapularis]
MMVENMTIFVAFLAIVTVFSMDNSEAHANKGDKNEPDGSPSQAECQSLGLSGRLGVVTGGASGIGRSVCMVLAREGATVIVADRNRTGSDETLQMLQGSYPGDHRVIYVDVSNSTAVDVLFEEIATYFPGRKISVVVNSAGIVEAAAPIQDMNDTQFDDTLATNLRGTFLIDRASVKHMLANNVTDGAIVNIASIIAKTAFPRYTPYSASKGGVVSLTKAVALEVASSGIRVNAMLPGPVDTPLLARLPPEVSSAFIAATAFKRKARPDEISETIAFMCSPKSSFLTGAAIDVTGGIIA